MKNKKEIIKKIEEDEDFIYCPRLGNSLENLLDKHPDGVDDDRIQKVLLISPLKFKELYESAIAKFRKSLGVE